MRRPLTSLALLGLLAGGAPLLAPAPSVAQTIEIISITPDTPNLGAVASAASGDTVFQVNPATGGVMRESGSGTRIDRHTTRATVRIKCVGKTQECNRADIRVRVASTGGVTGRAGRLTRFTVASGTATIKTPPRGPADPIEFVLNPIQRDVESSFHIGANFAIEGDSSGQPTGLSTSPFNVRVAVDPDTPALPGMDGRAVATVYRAVSITKHSDLQFGTIVRPSVGTGRVTLSEASDDRTVTGTNAVPLPSPAPARATYTVDGEGGRIISVDVPASFAMSRVGGGGTLTVSTSKTIGATVTLSGSLGAAGSASFGVGGSFELGSDTASGSYVGNFAVTVQYN